jgi:hypothetical protein
MSNYQQPNFSHLPMDPRIPSGYVINGQFYPNSMAPQMPSGYTNSGQFYTNPIPPQIPSGFPNSGQYYPTSTMPRTPSAYPNGGEFYSSPTALRRLSGYTQSPQAQWYPQAQPIQQQIPPAQIETAKARADRIADINTQAQLRRQHAEAKRAKDEKRHQQAEQTRRAEAARLQQSRLEEQQRLERENQEWAERLQRERHYIRREQLRHDPSANFRYYEEKLKYFPLQPGEKKNPYMTTLLANRPMPQEGEEELALAIQYAHDNWDSYFVFPKDVSCAARLQREKMEKEEEAKRKAGIVSMGDAGEEP